MSADELLTEIQQLQDEIRAAHEDARTKMGAFND